MRRNAWLILVGGGLLIGACGLLRPFNAPMGPGMPGFRNPFTQSFASNGEQIYFTGTNQNGQRIDYSGGTNFGGMMGGTPSCASCHGLDGRGGVHTMHMQVMDAPDIRIEVPVEEGEEHSDQGASEHDDQHAAYDLDAFRQAVVEGQHPDGEPLSRDMPRWDLGDEDLEDLFIYLQSLP
ncbi:MAG: hypothetical protein DWQ07_18540 [Chloroflexi bacterium]|nr:MAG: hypothetical protein DWQ07_18540 [Chloroflexota bacterium]